MKCARLHLHERSKPQVGSGRPTQAQERPRRYCQRRMVDPELDEDPRWADLLERFHCNSNTDTLDTLETLDKFQTQQHEDLFLSVQNLKFNGNIPERKRPKTCFKYKAFGDGKKHRMFVKQVVEEEEDPEECSSQLTSYYFDDYLKYIINNEQSTPASDTSTHFYPCNNKGKENKAVQVESRKQDKNLKKSKKSEVDAKKKIGKESNETDKHMPTDLTPEDIKVAYHKSGKRKCLTISRAQSPETVQVIRVDVVCNYSRSSTISELEDNRKQNDTDAQNVPRPKIMNNMNMKASHFTDKYLLTNTTKTLDENVSGGAKVTLLCKTFRLSRRTTAKSVNKQPQTKVLK